MPKLSPGFSLNAKVMVAVMPTPSALTLLLIASVGAKVSTASARLAAAPRFSAASMNLPAGSLMLAVAAARPAVGVKLA